MKKALVHGSRVVQVVAIGEDFPVSPLLQWVDCSDLTVADAWEFVGGVVRQKIIPAPQTPQSELDLADLRVFMDSLAADTTLPQSIRDLIVKLKKVII